MAPLQCSAGPKNPTLALVALALTLQVGHNNQKSGSEQGWFDEEVAPRLRWPHCSSACTRALGSFGPGPRYLAQTNPASPNSGSGQRPVWQFMTLFSQLRQLTRVWRRRKNTILAIFDSQKCYFPLTFDKTKSSTLEVIPYLIEDKHRLMIDSYCWLIFTALVDFHWQLISFLPPRLTQKSVQPTK